MTNLITTATSFLTRIVQIALACVLAGLGLAMVGLLATFGLAAIAVAILAAPFVGRPDDTAADAQTAA